MACLAILLAAGYGALAGAGGPVWAASGIAVDAGARFQTIDGFGFADAFGHAGELQALANTAEDRQILDLLLSPTTGAGFTILRILLPSDPAHTIELTAPTGPSAPPAYSWDDSSWGQVWLAQQAQVYGVRQFYADAWSAPGFMKTNGDEAHGGTLCGVPGASCTSGDWRQAYANYLVRYLSDYQGEGIPITHVGAFNEPSFTATYSSMIMSPAQAADFVKVLGPTVAAAGLHPEIVCCDAIGWGSAQGYATAIAGDAAASSAVGVLSSHGYAGAPDSALSGAGTQHVWQTEWSTFDTWDPSWDSGTDASGFTWAQHVQTGLTAANLSAFVYWSGQAFNLTNNAALINVTGGVPEPSKRLWALANFSRFIHPGAVRVGASSGDANLQVTAFQNPDGTVAVVVLNGSTSSTPVSVSLQNAGVDRATAVPYVTDGSNSTAAQASIPVRRGSFTATVGPRALVTYQVRPARRP